MKEIRDAVEFCRNWKECDVRDVEEVRKHKETLVRLAEIFLLRFQELNVVYGDGIDDAIDQMVIDKTYLNAIMCNLLSEEDILNIFNNYFNKMEAKHSKAIMDGDWGTNGGWFTNAGEMFNDLAKQIHSAQMEKLGGE